MKKNVAELIEDLVFYAREKLDLCLEDAVFARNRLLELFGLDEPSGKNGEKCELQTDILDPLVDYAYTNGICNNDLPKVLFETEIMGYVTPSPGLTIKTFDDLKKEQGLQKALEYLYKISVNSNYIRMSDVRKNICWYTEGDKGRVGITINLSKPEKDMKQVLAEKNFKGKKYPKCMLCLENIGFQGNIRHPARQTLRIIPINLNGENWHLQYSPYVYYKEHCIAFCDEHRPMKIDGNTFVRLCDFVEAFPDYFMGSNADLPIVGGSILAHDHYQGGAKVLPMLSRPLRKLYYKSDKINVGIRDWYNSVVSVFGTDRNKVINYAEKFLNEWRQYSDEGVGIKSYSDGENHNTITPIAQKEGDIYTIDLILRNNRTDLLHPYGIFHPTEDMHNIKKEGIGLIEAMGLFILPGRLKYQTEMLIGLLTKGNIDFEMVNSDEKISQHADMLEKIYNKCGKKPLERKEAERVIKEEIESICFKILECTAVFKDDEKGCSAFDKFLISTLAKIDN